MFNSDFVVPETNITLSFPYCVSVALDLDVGVLDDGYSCTKGCVDESIDQGSADSPSVAIFPAQVALEPLGWNRFAEVGRVLGV